MSFRGVTTATIHGRRWRIGYGFPGKTRGKVDDGSTSAANRRIIVHSKRNGRSRSLEEVICHELLHAMAPQLSEEFCTNFGELYDRILVKMRQADEG